MFCCLFFPFLDQALANWPLPVFVNKVLLEPSSVYLFTYCLWLFLQFNSNKKSSVTETVWLTTLKYPMALYRKCLLTLSHAHLPSRRHFKEGLLPASCFPLEWSFPPSTPFHCGFLSKTCSVSQLCWHTVSCKLKVYYTMVYTHLYFRTMTTVTLVTTHHLTSLQCVCVW